ncbi:MAG: 4'-phosphopantetheinyl transferase superfamily protein [Halieaceae bacterium]|nr:4'-phosphopantetheinyl transferase superfamily protein [Halieaceae bacterium]
MMEPLPIPAPGREAHLWIASLSGFHEPDLEAAARLQLSDSEWRRVQRLALPASRNLGRLSRLLLRHVLSQYNGVAPGQWRFVEARGGKPMLAQSTLPLEFNLSHSGDCVALGVSHRGHPIGVDIEIQRRRPFLRLARRYFADSEVADLEHLPSESSTARFYQYWTLKEAWVKAQGRGLWTALDSVYFHFDKNGRLWPMEEPPLPGYQCWSLTVAPRRCLAVVLGAATNNAKLRLFCVGEDFIPQPLHGILQGASAELTLSGGLKGS